jgi:CHAT domain-containing protein
MCVGACRRVVLIVGAVSVLAASLPARASASPGQTPEPALQDELAVARGLLQAGRYAAAELLLGPRLLAVRSSNDRESASALQIGDLWVEARVNGGKASQSDTLALAEHIVAVREHVPDPLALAKSLHNLGLAYEERGESSRATDVHQRAVAIVRSAEPSPRYSSLADGLEHLARALIGQERFADAQKALEEARSIQSALHSPESPESARVIFLQALLHRSDGDYEKAAVLLAEAGPRLTAARPQHPDTAAVLQLEGDLLFLRGRDLQLTRAKWTETLELSERTLGPEHPHVAVILRRLAIVSRFSGDRSEARALLERAMGIVDRAGAPCQKDLPELLNDFAMVLTWSADYQGARRRFQEALDRSTVCLGRNHSMTATVVFNQASLAIDMGDFALAERLLRQANADWSKGLGPIHPYVARGLGVLANVAALTGRDQEASRLLERALTLRRQALGPHHPDVAVILVRLAELAEKNGSLTVASQRLGLALEIYEQGQGVALDPDYFAKALQLRARLSARRGDLEAARKDYGEVAAIRLRIFGARHPMTATARGDVAAADFALGFAESALDGALLAEAEGRDQLQMTARFLPGRQALLYADQRPRGLSLALSTLSSGRIDGASRVLDAVVRSRGLVLDELAERSRWTAAAAPEQAALHASVAARQARYATLMLRNVQGEAVPRALLDEARQRAEESERELAEQSAVDRDDLARAKTGLNEVRQALPEGTALVSFVRYDRTRITAVNGRSVATVRPWYVALIVTSTAATPVVISLGTAVAIESAVEAWRNEFREAAIVADRADPAASLLSYRAAGGRLRRLVWDPLARHLSGALRVFIVPDGALNLVSFPSLPIGSTRYLVETSPVLHLLSTERDLLQNSAVSSGRGLLAVGGPSYDATPASTVASTRGNVGCGNGVALRFGDLPGTRTEVADIARVWTMRPDASSSPARDDLLVLDRRGASKAAVMRAARGRLVLHFATHGFFLDSECQPTAAGTRGVGGLTVTADPVSRSRRSQNPLLLSGLAFAGANVRASVREDRDTGILTAEEVASLDLHGIEWAVLSACDTGLGEIKAGEGVFGLRRAFQIAGVRTVIMSLWSVEDQSTRTWMRALYRGRFQKGASTADAVRDASVQVLQARRARGESTHPFYWAGFVAAGDWR